MLPRPVDPSTGCSSHQCPPSPAGSISSAAAPAVASARTIARRIGRTPAPAVAGRRRPRARSAPPAARRQRTGSRPRTRVDGHVRGEVTTPSGTGGTWRPARKPVRVPAPAARPAGVRSRRPARSPAPEWTQPPTPRPAVPPISATPPRSQRPPAVQPDRSAASDRGSPDGRRRPRRSTWRSRPASSSSARSSGTLSSHSVASSSPVTAVGQVRPPADLGRAGRPGAAPPRPRSVAAGPASRPVPARGSATSSSPRPAPTSTTSSAWGTPERRVDPLAATGSSAPANSGEAWTLVRKCAVRPVAGHVEAARPVERPLHGRSASAPGRQPYRSASGPASEDRHRPLSDGVRTAGYWVTTGTPSEDWIMHMSAPLRP